MDANQTSAIRRQLLDERERIVSDWQAHGGASGPGADWDLKDPDERAVLLTSETVERQIANDDLQLLRKVELALHRLDEGTYQQCAQCGATIPLQRLLAKPSVSLCLACQQLKDASKS